MSVTCGAKSVLFLLPRRCRGRMAGSFLSVPGGPVPACGGLEERTEVGPGGAGSSRGCSDFLRADPEASHPEVPRAAAFLAVALPGQDWPS